MSHKSVKYCIGFALMSMVPGTGLIAQMAMHDSITSSNPQIPVIYELPYLPGKKVSIAQGYNGFFSHKGEYSLDFWMRKGQIICAAREGTVVEARSDSKKGGPSKKYISDGNYIIVKHNDSTYAAYWHLQYDGVMVKVGDKVSAGQPIGKVGSTGFSSGPHLHFEVYYYSHRSGYKTIPTVFRTSRGIKKPKAWHFYRRPA